MVFSSEKAMPSKLALIFLSACLVGAVGHGQDAAPARTGSKEESGVTGRWPGLLGPHRNGWVDDFIVPEKWPDRLKQMWRVEVGSGYGTPLVDGGRVYQHSREGDEEVVRCLDLKDGHEGWRIWGSFLVKRGGGPVGIGGPPLHVAAS